MEVSNSRSPAGEVESLRGAAFVLDTGTLEIRGRVIRLLGVEGAGGKEARNFMRYLRNREVICEPAGTGDEHRCRVGDQDLSQVILYNGGSRATADASSELKAAEEQARVARVGIWAR